MTTIFPFYTWNGVGTGNTWNDPHNWGVVAYNDDGMLFGEVPPNPPDASDTVDFPTDATIVDSGTAENVEGVASLTIDGGSITATDTFFIVYGGVTVNNGSIASKTFKSTYTNEGTTSLDNSTLTTSHYLEVNGSMAR